MKTDTLQPSFLQPTDHLDRSSFLEQGHSIDEVPNAIDGDKGISFCSVML
jgi:hypothetical protein